MTEVHRHHACPVCGLRFMVAFEAAEGLGDGAITLTCPRAPGGGEQLAGGPQCQGYIVTHLPARYRVFPADN